MKYFILFLFSILFVSPLIGQVNDTDKIIQYSPSPEWYHFQQNVRIDPTSFFSRYGSEFGLSKNDGMILIKTEKDQLGFTHYRYQQTYKGLPIEGAEFILHINEAKSKKGNGNIVTGLSKSSTASVTENRALQTALNHINAKVYAWQDPKVQRELKERQKDPSATYYPKGKLVWVEKGCDNYFSADKFVLAWKFEIHDNHFEKSQLVYVNALSGELVKEIPLVYACDIGGAHTTWYGNRTTMTNFQNNNFILLNDCGISQIHTRNWNDGNIIEYMDANNIWDAANQQSAVTAHWAAEQSQSYFSVIHNRTGGFNNQGGDIDLLNNMLYSGNFGNNADFTLINGGVTGRIRSGRGDTNLPTDDWNTLDIIGHEFTHGVTLSTADLVYQGESGALNESFSDIFGTAVERWSENNLNSDWLVGEDRGTAIRNMSNPNQFGQPDTYQGNNWIDINSTVDQGGVHINSGVQNFWFFLLSSGGSGTNDLGNNYSLSGIGFNNARAIAYRSLTTYLTPNSNFAHARQASIWASTDIFGACSSQTIEVAKAWYAVGVGSEIQVTALACGNIKGIQYLKSNTISTGIDCFQQFTAIENGADVTLEGGLEVYLKKGFHAANGSKFRAFIGNCDNKELLIPNDPELNDAYAVDNSFVTDEVKERYNNLFKIYPNPFNNELKIEFELLESSAVSIILTDLSTGRDIVLIDKEKLIKGRQSKKIETHKLPRGLYAYRFISGNNIITGKLIKQ